MTIQRINETPKAMPAATPNDEESDSSTELSKLAYTAMKMTIHAALTPILAKSVRKRTALGGSGVGDGSGIPIKRPNAANKPMRRSVAPKQSDDQRE